MTENSLVHKHRRVVEISHTRKIVIGVVEILIGLLIYFIFAAKTSGDSLTKFVMTPGGIDQGQLSDWILPSKITLIILAVVSGLALAGASAISHDIYARVIKKGQASEAAEIRVSKIATICLGFVAIILGILFEFIQYPEGYETP